MIDSTCPLCESAAQFDFHDYENLKRYKCPHCKEYVISRAAERMLNDHSARKTALAQLALKGWDDSLLVITRGPVSAEQPSELHAQFKSRREALLGKP